MDADERDRSSSSSSLSSSSSSSGAVQVSTSTGTGTGAIASAELDSDSASLTLPTETTQASNAQQQQPSLLPLPVRSKRSCKREERLERKRVHRAEFKAQQRIERERELAHLSSRLQPSPTDGSSTASADATDATVSTASTATASDSSDAATDSMSTLFRMQEPGGSAVSYVLRDGLRHVVPYTFHFQVRAKERWIGRPLLDVLRGEYRRADPTYYARAIADGRVTMNGQAADPAHVFRHADRLGHAMHRHEPYVVDAPIGIVHEDDRVLIVDKPASLPIHPCGRYYHNSLIAILRHQGRGTLLPIHRLDRLTSGLVLLAKTGDVAMHMSTALQNKEMQKVYLARVMGEFPATPEQLEAVLAASSTSVSAADINVPTLTPEQNSSAPAEVEVGAAAAAPAPATAATAATPATATTAATAADTTDATAQPHRVPLHASVTLSSDAPGEICIDAPILCTSKMRGTHAVDARGKPARTLVRRRHFDGLTSVVECFPVTGRTHQIRLHLQHAGFPIANDMVHGGRLYASNAFSCADHPSPGERVADCADCAVNAAFYARRDFCSGIWLHAWRYSHGGAQWSFETRVPAWAAEEFDSRAALATPIEGAGAVWGGIIGGADDEVDEQG